MSWLTGFPWVEDLTPGPPEAPPSRGQAASVLLRRQALLPSSGGPEMSRDTRAAVTRKKPHVFTQFCDDHQGFSFGFCLAVPTLFHVKYFTEFGYFKTVRPDKVAATFLSKNGVGTRSCSDSRAGRGPMGGKYWGTMRNRQQMDQQQTPKWVKRGNISSSESFTHADTLR